jgi:hypothetical protein
MRAELRPGDVLLVDDHSSTGHTLTYRGETLLIEVDVADEWVPEGVVPPAIEEGRRSADEAANVKRMFVADLKAHFGPLDELFSKDPGTNEDNQVLALSFMSLSPRSFGDWHTEERTSLVVVLAGGFELEVGGGGGSVEVFWPGDVCLVEDHEGQGHITRTHGETRFAAIVVPPGAY